LKENASNLIRFASLEPEFLVLQLSKGKIIMAIAAVSEDLFVFVQSNFTVVKTHCMDKVSPLRLGDYMLVESFVSTKFIYSLFSSPFTTTYFSHLYN